MKINDNYHLYEKGCVLLKGAVAVDLKNWVVVETGLHLFIACVLLRDIFFIYRVSASLGISRGSYDWKYVPGEVGLKTFLFLRCHLLYFAFYLPSLISKI